MRIVQLSAGSPADTRSRMIRLLFAFCCLVTVLPAVHADPMSAHTPTVARFAARAEQREPLSVVFLGGSLTWGANASDPGTTSYRGLMMRYLREKYPRTPITFHDAAIGGTGSQLGLFRLERDVFLQKPDLVFLDFTVNDGSDDTDPQTLASYERIVRELLARDCSIMPVLMLFKWHAEKPGAPLPPRHQAHLKLAAAYGLPVANILEHVRALVASGVKPADLWTLGNDGAHPGDEGYRAFFDAVRHRYEQAAALPSAASIPPQPVFDDLYPKRTRRLLTDALPAGWVRAHTYRTSLWFDGLSSRWMGDVGLATAKNQPAALEVEFEGSLVGFFGERNGLTPPIRVWIDGQPVRAPKSKDDTWKLDTSAFAPPHPGSGNLFIWQPLANNLPDGRHTLRIEPVWDDAASGAELRIESICSAGR